MDTIDETIFEGGTGLRISADAAPVEEQGPVSTPASRAGDDEWAEQRLFRVVLNLANGEWAEVASFDDEESADAHARELAARLATTSEWPRIRGRYLRPETILSIEISERRRLAGSQARAAWGQTLDG